MPTAPHNMNNSRNPTLPRYGSGAYAGCLMHTTDLGGYPLFYMDNEGSTLCPDCAERSDSDPDEMDQFRPRHVDANWEDSEMYCDDCGASIPSAYEDEEDPKEGAS